MDARAYHHCYATVGKVLNAFHSFQHGVIGVGHTPRIKGRTDPSVALALGRIAFTHEPMNPLKIDVNVTVGCSLPFKHYPVKLLSILPFRGHTERNQCIVSSFVQ